MIYIWRSICCRNESENRVSLGTILNFVCGLGTMGMKERSHGPTRGTQDTRRYS
jgi:hypothetical protein